MNIFTENFKKKDLIQIVIMFVSLLFTQFLLPVSIAGTTIYIYYIEVFIIAMFLIALINIIVKKAKINLKKRELLWLILFIGWFALVTVYRFITTGDLTGGFINFRVLIFPIILLLIFRQYNVNTKNIFYGVFAFIACINIYQIISLIFYAKSFRQIKGLGNINIYLCFALAVLPLLIGYIKKSKSKVLKTIAVLNIAVIILLSLFSGSRIGVIITPVISVISYFAVNKFNKKSVVIFIASLASLTVVISAIFVAGIYDAKYNFFRVGGPVFDVFNITVDVPDDEPQADGTKSDLEQAQINATDSNSMRSEVWKKSVEHIRENPIFGRGNTDIVFYVNFVGIDEPVKFAQSPHNFILEMWLALGLPGMLIYLAAVAITAIKILFGKYTVTQKINFTLILLSVFGFSFFQPLVTSYFAVSCILWISVYLFAFSSEQIK